MISRGRDMSGYIESVRVRGGGIRPGQAPEEINIGTLVRHTEGGFDLVDCASCVIAPALQHDRRAQGSALRLLGRTGSLLAGGPDGQTKGYGHIVGRNSLPPEVGR